MAETKPLVLDVDGTFLKTDVLFECFWGALGKKPFAVLGCVMRNFSRPAVLKQELAGIANLRMDLLPVNPDMRKLASESRLDGREIVLASASYIPLVAQLAREHGLSERVFASDGQVNLKGAAKAKALTDAFGECGFDYAGNEEVDRAIWEKSEVAVMVGDHGNIEKSLTAAGKTVIKFDGGWRKRDLIKGLRPHQWVKNLLLFMPVVAAHEFTISALLLVILGIAAFSAAASSIYIVNDLLDLEADRLHPTKRLRPFASGSVPIRVGMVTCVLLALVALGIGAFLGIAFLAVIVFYMLLSLAYSLRLKRMRWADIATLATLYTLRAVAGAAASQVEISGFMLIFIFPVFITLACVKRMTELTLASGDERLPGRGYSRRDRLKLLKLAGIGTIGALLIFWVYSFTDQAQDLYPTQWMLWVALIPITAWLVRMVRLGYLGKQDYDPIVFAMRDKRGLGLLMITLSLMFYGAGLWQQWFGF